jgi:EAL domain-containing protein (putative c-di-GMP-specific phosphodiesterase class I)
MPSRANTEQWDGLPPVNDGFACAFTAGCAFEQGGLDPCVQAVRPGPGPHSAYPEPQVQASPLDEVERAISIEAGRALGRFRNLRFDSGFQPIYSLPHSRIVGHEALLRATRSDGTALSPLQALAAAQNDAELVFADRLCRALHLCNYQDVDDGGSEASWLFLNVSTRVVTQRHDFGSFFTDLLSRCGFPTRRVVVEILEGAVPDLSLLSDAVAWYRSLGCLVALDDFGAEASNIERIWRTSPDIVKLDRKLIAAAAQSPKAQRVLPAIVALIHEAGSLALIEGVETEQQAAIALDCDADLVQGFHFARPAARPLRHGDGGIGALAARHRTASAGARQRAVLEAYAVEFRLVAQRLRQGGALAQACAYLLTLSRVDRCYLIGENGLQIGASVVPPARQPATTRFAPLEDAAGANWSRKPYHYQALAQPGEVQISRPYLSVANSCLCVTLSLAILQHGEWRVLCCDVNWEE